jgi:prolyl-tRNA synthetase
VHLVAAGKDAELLAAADSLAVELDAAGVRVLLDDRGNVSPGVKFKDAELIGVPTIVTVGRKLADAMVEVRDRGTGERADVPLDAVVDVLAAWVRDGGSVLDRCARSDAAGSAP